MRVFRGSVLMLLVGVCIAVPAFAEKSAPAPRTENVIFVMADGLRWQEVFRGADETMFLKDNGFRDAAVAKSKYRRETTEASRELLMPFFWTVMARQGQVYGNLDKGSRASVTNGLNFSFPGYSETLCGYADPGVNSNNKIPNPNVTVMEWLGKNPKYQGKLAAFGAWDAFPSIFNRDRCGFYVNASYEPLTGVRKSRELDMLNTLRAETAHFWEGECFDSFTFQSAMMYFKQHKPRIFFVCLGEPDEWAHDTRYDLYLDSIKLADAYVKEIWETAQSMRKYRGKTTLIFATDHGRGDAPTEWRGHGTKTKGSENIWMGFLGPDTPALGERAQIAPVTQNQIAATLAAFLGEDYCAAQPKAGKPVTDAVKIPPAR